MDANFSLKHLKLDLEFEIYERSSLVGRSSNCDIQIDRETLSREHARLSQKGEELFLQDLHSTNGSFVNDKQVDDATRVRPGDVLRFGQEAFILQQSGVETTVLINRSALANADSAMLVADEEEADGTVMLQSISLPAGWSSSDSDDNLALAVSDKDKSLLGALKKHAQSKLVHKYGLLVATLSENRAPSVKLVSTDKKQASWFIGRGQLSDVILEDPRVSERHAEIVFEQGRWTLKDFASRNGTLKNGLSIKALEIVQKENVEIGPFHLLFECIRSK